MTDKNPLIDDLSLTISNSEWVQIPTKEYLRLLEADAILDALYGAGVDNWEGYDIAMEMLSDDDDNN